MKLAENNFKNSLQNKEQSYGIWNAIADTYVGEICAGAGYDWMVIDAEHGTFDYRSIIYQFQAVKSYNTHSILRVPDSNPTFIKRILDTGVQNILVPMVETKEQAEKLVKSIQYPPEGIRGVAPAMARASLWGKIEQYNPEANKQIALILQIESVEGIKNLDSIVRVKGIDCIFIGPSDLASSMGYPGGINHPNVKKVIIEAIETIRKNNLSAGILALTSEEVNFYKEAGANMIGTAVDLLLLSTSVRSKAIRD